MAVKIIQFQAMPNDEYYQGCTIGLGNDGVVYINTGTTWSVHHPLEFEVEPVDDSKPLEYSLTLRSVDVLERINVYTENDLKKLSITYSGLVNLKGCGHKSADEIIDFKRGLNNEKS